MASLLALVEAAREELIAPLLADRNRVSALFPGSAGQIEQFVPAAGAVERLFRRAFAVTARARVAQAFAYVGSATKGFSTDLFACEVRFTAVNRLLLLSAETGLLKFYTTWLARSRMTRLLALVFKTI